MTDEQYDRIMAVIDIMAEHAGETITRKPDNDRMLELLEELTDAVDDVVLAKYREAQETVEAFKNTLTRR